MKNNNSYWSDRANLRMASYHKDSDETIYRINNAYDKAIEDINSDINKIFFKFQSDSGLSIAEAKELLNSKIPTKELESIRSKINGIEDKELKRSLMAQINANAYKARITRLESLKESINVNIAKVADIQLKQGELSYINSINDAYYKNIYDIQKGTGLGFDFSPMPVDRIEEVLKNSWSGKHYSERVWGNSQVLAEKLEETITAGLMSGKSSRRMALELAELSQYGKMASERLVRTETTYIANAAELESYKECGIDKYVFVATLDLRTSDVCRSMDGKIIEVSKGSAGENLPPLHPWCRSTTIAYMGDEWYNNLKRRARDPETGETYTVPGNMKYDEWYKQHVVDKYGEQKAETFQKRIKNKASDRKQHSKYKEVLGKDAPKTLKDFQDLKYNNIKEWEELKFKYKDYKEKDVAIFTEDVSIPQNRKEHIWLGENRFLNPTKPEKGGGILKGGGHGQGALELMEKHYNAMESRQGIISDKKFEKAISVLGFEYKEYENGVRIGNIFGVSNDDKKYNWGQAWFPSNWAEEDIYEAGQYILKLSDKKSFDVEVLRSDNTVAKVDKYAEYKGISIGVTVNYKDGKPFIGTIFPDKDFRFNKNIKEKENSYYKKGEREDENNKFN